MNLYHVLMGILVVYNMVVFFVYGYDKYCAKKSKWRVPEKVLMGLAFFLGGVGAFFGMQVYRHKTKHTVFQIFIPLFTIIQLVVFIGVGIRFA